MHAFRNMDLHQGDAAGEGIFTDAGDAARDSNALDGAAVFKRKFILLQVIKIMGKLRGLKVL